MNARPAFADDWSTLARLAATLLDQRRTGDPRAVITGSMSPQQQDRRLRSATALVRIWQAVVEKTAMPSLPATAEEIRADLAHMIERAEAQEKAGQIPPSNADLPAALRALAWHMHPWEDRAPGEPPARPRILFLHTLNAQLREQHTSQRMAA